MINTAYFHRENLHQKLLPHTLVHTKRTPTAFLKRSPYGFFLYNIANNLIPFSDMPVYSHMHSML